VKQKHKFALNEVRQYMLREKIDFFLATSTDEYLNEYIPLENNSRYILTGFTGSTGDVLISLKKVWLFVDGRYHEQVDKETDSAIITTVKLEGTQTQRSKIIEIINSYPRKNSKCAIPSSKLSYSGYSALKKELPQVEFIPLKCDIVPTLSNNPHIPTEWKLFTVPHEISGVTPNEKLHSVNQKMKETGIDILVITKLEEIAWLTDLRATGLPYSSSFYAKAIIEDNKCRLFMDLDKIPDEVFEIRRSNFEYLDEDEFELYIQKYLEKNLKIAFEATSTPLSIYNELEYTKNTLISLEASPITEMKAIKNKNELNHLRECFLKTDIVMSRTKTWINQMVEAKRRVSEKMISHQVEQYFYEENAASLSFQVISAIGKNTSIVHYSKPKTSIYARPGDIILIDCGAYFEGGYATDITRTFLVGHDVAVLPVLKQVYTAVLKGILNGLNYPMTGKTTGFDIDKAVRDIVNSNSPEGYVFSHGTGHGIGISVHEAPPRVSPSEYAKVPLAEGMCFTIEPGLYCEGKGGVRLENTVVIVKENGQPKIKSLAKSNFDEKLIDYSMLTKQEIQWLRDYQKKAID
jgi:Xaa-Pro aminopeptidase